MKTNAELNDKYLSGEKSICWDRVLVMFYEVSDQGNFHSLRANKPLSVKSILTARFVIGLHTVEGRTETRKIS